MDEDRLDSAGRDDRGYVDRLQAHSADRHPELTNRIVIERYGLTFTYYRTTNSIVVSDRGIPVDAAPLGEGLGEEATIEHVEQWVSRWLLWDTDRALQAAMVDLRRRRESEQSEGG